MIGAERPVHILTFVQVQTILMDPKSQELLELLKKERVYGTLSTQDQINSRQHAERIMGPDENLFRMDWVCFSVLDKAVWLTTSHSYLRAIP